MIPLVKTFIPKREELMPALEKELYSGYIATGETVGRFEQGFGSLIGNDNFVALNSGSAALHVALCLAGVGAGDEVISTPMTAEPTNTVIAQTGAKIVWADVDPDTGLISPESIREMITEKTKAIVVVHYAGMVCDMNAINTLSMAWNIPVIEDDAHALLARFKGRPIGSNSAFTCFSFQAIKQMTTVDGGGLAVKDSNLVSEAKRLRWFGLDKGVSRLENDIKRIGYKYAMNNVTAAMGLAQLRHVEDVVGSCISNGRYYDRALSKVPGVFTVPYYADTAPSYWLYTMKVDCRDDFIRAMRSRGVEASPLHHRSDTHSVFAYAKRELPGLEQWCEKFVHIPCGWWVGAEEREKIVEAIKAGW